MVSSIWPRWSACWRRERSRALVALMLANNETGVIQPVAEAARIAHAHGALFHCDAVQAAGKIAVDFDALGADLMTVSAHKLGGPPGVGALIVADHVPLTAQQRGGGQERGRRAGTENLAGIVGFGVAAEIAAGELGAMAEARRSARRSGAAGDCCGARRRRVRPRCAASVQYDMPSPAGPDAARCR